ALDRNLVQGPLVDRAHVVVGDARQHILEQARLLVDRTRGPGVALQQPAAGGQRDHRDHGDQEELPVLHETPRSVSVAAMTSRHAASCTACLDCDASMWTTPGPPAARYAWRTRLWKASPRRSNRSCTLRARRCRAPPSSTGTSSTKVMSGTRPPVARRFAVSTSARGSPAPATWYARVERSNRSAITTCPAASAGRITRVTRSARAA